MQKKFQCLQKGLNCKHNLFRNVNFFRQTVVDLEKYIFEAITDAIVPILMKKFRQNNLNFRIITIFREIGTWHPRIDNRLCKHKISKFQR